MNKTDIQKSLCGPFENENNPGEYFTFDKAGNAIPISVTSLAEGTAFSLINDLTVGAFRLDQGEDEIDFNVAEGHVFNF